MIVFPNCKINLGLRITGKRADGYHNIETVFYPIPLKDALEIIHSQDHHPEEGVSLSQSGTPVAGNDQDNLCVKAWQLLKKDFPHLPPIKLHLHKRIPMGAGLGGGSSDGAFTLRTLNEKFSLGLTKDRLLSYALKLGSDCPFFIINHPCIATGRGEILQEIDLDLSGFQLVLVNPGIHVNTGWAFSQLPVNSSGEEVPSLSFNSPQQIVKNQPIAEWKQQLVNEFEAPVFANFPEISAIKETLYSSGALYAAMSGSGSTVFGIFEKGTDAISLNFPANYFVESLLL